jgi:hypothetical protein
VIADPREIVVELLATWLVRKRRIWLELIEVLFPYPVERGAIQFRSAADQVIGDGFPPLRISALCSLVLKSRT